MIHFYFSGTDTNAENYITAWQIQYANDGGIKTLICYGPKPVDQLVAYPQWSMWAGFLTFDL